MKTTIAIVIAALMGTLLGVYLGSAEFSGDIDEVAALATDAGRTNLPEGGPSGVVSGYPRVKVQGDTEFDFGVMEKDQTRTHTFVFENVGDTDLRLTKGETTCKCTLSDLAKDVIAPGESAEVHLEWTPKTFAREFRQRATIVTNDPSRPNVELVVHGRVTQTVRPVPEEVLFKNVSLTEARSATIFVYCYRAGKFTLNAGGFQNASSAEHFDADIKPLSAEQLLVEPDAISGREVTITIKPGMNLGPIEQTLTLVTEQEDLPNLDIPIRGSVTGDITLVAGSTPYSSEQKVLKLGAVNRHKGATFQMHLLVKGPHAKETRLSVGHVDPNDVLNVTIDSENPRRLKDGAVLMYPMTVEVPVGSRAVNRLGGRQTTNSTKLGKITIETTHPQTKELSIHVQFATEG